MGKKENYKFKTILEDYAKKQKITLYELAKKSGINLSNIYRWDKNVPNVIELSKVAKILKISLDEIVDKVM